MTCPPRCSRYFPFAFPPLVGFLFVLLLAGCDRSAPSPPQQGPVEVTVARPLVTPIVEWDEYTGRLDALDFVEVRARVSGYLKSLHFNEGELVEAGQLLAIIDPRPFEAALKAAKAQLNEAEAKLTEAESMRNQAMAEQADAEAQLTLKNRQLDRSKQLFEQNAISQDELDITASEQLQAKAALEAANAKIKTAEAGIETAKAAIATAEANVQSAELDLSYTVIRSPIDGRISEQMVTEGNLISGGSANSTMLTTIVSTDPIHCYFDANEREFLKYARLAEQGKRVSSRNAKNPVYLSLVDEEGYPHKGHMDFVDNRLDPNTGTMRGRAIFRNEDNVLTPGLFAEVRLPGTGRYEAVMIPDSAIGSDQKQKFVYVIDGEDKVERREVTLGSIVDGLRVVKDGLTGADLFVTKGLQLIRQGATVTYEEPETIEKREDDGLPDNYEPVPREEWINRPATDAPEGVKKFGDPSSITDPEPEDLPGEQPSSSLRESI